MVGYKNGRMKKMTNYTIKFCIIGEASMAAEQWKIDYN